MSRLPRPCLGAVNASGVREDCGVATVASRCPKHESMFQARRRPSPTQRGYDAPYQKDRKRLLAERPVCELQLEGCTFWATTADHPVALAAGGSRRQSLVPACANCNRVKGARPLAAASTRARRGPLAGR